MTRVLVTTLIALLMTVLFVDSADAQRRSSRRRRRRQPPAEEPATPPEAPADPNAPPASPFDEPAAATPARPAQAATPAPAGQAATPPAQAIPPAAATPAEEPSEQPTAEFDPGPAPPDVSPIRDDYVALMDELVQARMRVAALGSELFRTRITVDLQDRTGDDTNLARLVVHLDGAPVYQVDGGGDGLDDGREIFAGSLAPGPHVLRIEVEQRARSDESYRYTLQQDFRFQVVRERLSEVTLVLEDDSDIASSFPSGGEGRYEVRTRMRVATRALPDR
ncbi:MAG: hypothetical protein H6719_31310 [Sandaracinaceae bacterium]|nr:hypothetical protein [Sandaracinaceae bacterium]